MSIFGIIVLLRVQVHQLSIWCIPNFILIIMHITSTFKCSECKQQYSRNIVWMLLKLAKSTCFNSIDILRVAHIDFSLRKMRNNLLSPDSCVYVIMTAHWTPASITHFKLNVVPYLVFCSGILKSGILKSKLREPYFALLYKLQIYVNFNMN